MTTRMKGILGLTSLTLGVGLVLFGIWLYAPPVAYIVSGLVIIAIVGATVYEPTKSGNS